MTREEAVTREELETLSTPELHDRAVERARHRLDVGFLWRLVKTLPVAEAASGHLRASEADVVSLSSLLSDVLVSGRGDVGEELRPLYIDYLLEHP